MIVKIKNTKIKQQNVKRQTNFKQKYQKRKKYKKIKIISKSTERIRIGPKFKMYKKHKNGSKIYFFKTLKSIPILSYTYL